MERGAAPAARALQARGPSGSGIRPGAKRPHAIQFATDAGHDQRQCWKRAVKGRAPRRPSNAARSAEGRSVPFAKGTRTPAKACNGILEAPLGAPPLDLRGQTPAVPRRGTRDGHPRGRPTPRRISLGCLTRESNHSAGLVSRMRCSATSAFTRVFDALWRCTADPGPRLFVDPSETGVPGLQRTTSCCAAPGTRV